MHLAPAAISPSTAPEGMCYCWAEPRGQAEQTLRVPAHPGSQAPWGGMACRACGQMGRGTPSGSQWGQGCRQDRTGSIACRSELQGQDLCSRRWAEGRGLAAQPTWLRAPSSLWMSCPAAEHRWLRAQVFRPTALGGDVSSASS